MSKLSHMSIVEIPFAQASDLVEKFLVTHTAKDGDITLLLSASGAAVNLPGVRLEREVKVTFLRRPGANQTSVFHLTWEPLERGPFPTFSGTLTVAEDETYETCRLVLEGSYKPPFGIAGAAFDAALGSRLAEATAKHLLGTIGSFMSAAHQEVELEKRRRTLMMHQGS